MLSLQPSFDLVRKALRLPRPDILTKVTDRWVLASGSPVEVRKAKFLPGQLERICGSQFGTIPEVVRDFVGGFESPQGPTMAYQLKNAALLDGVLYAKNAVRHLKPRTNPFAKRFEPETIAQAALYESWPGNRWFGNWLSDDCLTYRLAEFAGYPATSEPALLHKLEYEQLLHMSPTRVSSVCFEELILFDDQPHNEGKRWRASELRRRLVGAEPPRHPGVFLLRRASGERRVLRNEQAIAEHLAAKRGFRVIDPSHLSVPDIIAACGGAQAVVGTEGSHLVHGLMLMPPEARVLVIQPPARVVSVLKLITDRQGQDYSFVVGAGSDEDFSVCVGEIERTLDLA